MDLYSPDELPGKLLNAIYARAPESTDCTQQELFNIFYKEFKELKQILLDCNFTFLKTQMRIFSHSDVLPLGVSDIVDFSIPKAFWEECEKLQFNQEQITRFFADYSKLLDTVFLSKYEMDNYIGIDSYVIFKSFFESLEEYPHYGNKSRNFRPVFLKFISTHIMVLPGYLRLPLMIKHVSIVSDFIVLGNAIRNNQIEFGALKRLFYVIRIRANLAWEDTKNLIMGKDSKIEVPELSDFYIDKTNWN